LIISQSLGARRAIFALITKRCSWRVREARPISRSQLHTSTSPDVLLAPLCRRKSSGWPGPPQFHRAHGYSGRDGAR